MRGRAGEDMADPFPDWAPTDKGFVALSFHRRQCNDERREAAVTET
jgi:hypothetical protein